MNRALRCLASLCLALLAGLAVAAEQRVALVIGNNAYPSAPLVNPVNDARAVAAKLKSLGFQVIERENLNVRQIGPALREFRSRLAPGGVALFFYAGHGLQVQGLNYLTAVDAEIVSEEDVSLQSLEVGKLLQVMEESKTRLNLVFLDACRNNPYARSFRSGSAGLAKVSAPSGTLISFATRPGSVAADGSGRNGLYTEKLLAAMAITDQPIELVLKQVVAGVKAASRGQQEPWMEGSIEGDFCFAACAAQATSAPTMAVDGSANERTYWESVKDSRNPDELQAYLRRYPQGLFADLAQSRRQALLVRPAAPVVPAPVQPGTAVMDCAQCPAIVASQGPAVVNVSATQVVVPAGADPAETEALFKKFFAKEAALPPREGRQRAIGSGFIISPDGYILTSAGVVEDAETVEVRLSDRRVFPATVVGSDPGTGIALIKVEPGPAGLPTARLGHARDIRVGETVLAIGSPFGVDNTASVGIVSGTGRSLPNQDVMPYLQTSMTLYPGYGGGPLFNMVGEVVGVNLRIATPGGQAAGMSFAVPIELALAAQEQLRAHGRVRHGRIGVTLQEISPELESASGAKANQGVLVQAVEPGGPAARAGLAAGDVIAAVDGNAVHSVRDVVRQIAGTPIGQPVSIRFLRKGTTMRRMVTVAEAP